MKLRRLSGICFVAGLAMTIFPQNAHAQFTIVPTFDTSITNLANASAVESSINSALSFYDTHITNNATVYIQFNYQDQSQGPALGSSATAQDLVSYSDYANGLSHTVSGNRSFLQYVPIQANDPVIGGSQMYITSAQGRILGLGGLGNTGNNGHQDSVVSLGTDLTYFNNSPVAGEYNLEEVVQHEVNEVLGLSSALDGATNNTDATNLPGSIASLDLYRYSAPGQHSFTTAYLGGPGPGYPSYGPQVYFSLDGGNTVVNYFNQLDQGDFHDWASAFEPFIQPPDLQDAFATPASSSTDYADTPLMAADNILELHSIGYNFATPEPGTYQFAGILLMSGIAIARRRRKQ